jgi:MFS family permease
MTSSSGYSISEHIDPTTGRLHGRALALLAVLCAAFFLDALDVSMVNVTLPSIQRGLHLSTSSLQWVVSGYVLGFGGFLLVGGRAADVFGRRRIFLIALTVFVIASAVGGVASAGAVLIASRFVKGVAAGFTAPAGLSIITTSFPEGAARNRALAAYTATGSAGFTFGLVAGGLLTQLSWRLVFFVPAGIAAITLVAGSRLVPGDDTRDDANRRLDLPGAISVTAAMLLLVYTLTEAPQHGWGSARTLLSLLAAALLLVGFVLIERRHPSPLVPLRLLRSASRLRAYLAGMAFVGGWAAAQFIATLYLQDTRGWTALETAAAFWPCGVLGIFVAPRLEGLIERFGLQAVLAGGLTLAVATYALMLPINMGTRYWIGLFPSFALIGIAFGLTFSTVNISATNGVAAHEQGIASGMLQTAIQFGTALLLAIATAVNLANTRHHGTAHGALRGYHAALLVPLIAVSTALVLTLASFARTRRAGTRAVSTTAAEARSLLGTPSS